MTLDMTTVQYSLLHTFTRHFLEVCADLIEEGFELDDLEQVGKGISGVRMALVGLEGLDPGNANPIAAPARNAGAPTRAASMLKN